MKILFVYESRIMFVLTHTHIYIYTFDYSSIGNQSIESTNRAYYLRKRQRHTFSLISNTHLRAFAHTHTHTQTQYLAGGYYIHTTIQLERTNADDSQKTAATQLHCNFIVPLFFYARPLFGRCLTFC